MKKNMFWVIVFSFLPGFGHMFLGFTRRGVAIMSTFFAVIGVMVFFEVAPFGFILPVLWCYGIFDAVKINRAGGEGVTDDFWIYRNYNGCRGPLLSGSNAKWLGWALILMGAAFIYKSFLSPVLYDLFGDFEVARRLIYNFPSLIVSFVVIYLGVRLISPPKKVQAAEPREEDAE